MMQDVLGTVLSNHCIADGIYKLTVRLPEEFHAECKPGQFAQLAIPNADAHILRRPISIHSFGEIGRTVSFVYQVKGAGTDRLTQCSEGNAIQMLLPLGNGFSLPENADKILFIGAGIGAAPLKYAAQCFSDKKIIMVLGFKNKEKAYLIQKYQECSERLMLCSDDGSIGEKSYVGAVARRVAQAEKPGVIMACGPNIVLQQVKEFAEELTIPCQLSMEARMGCGIGACVVCNVKIGTKESWHYKRCCVDGPVFDAKEVVFDD